MGFENRNYALDFLRGIAVGLMVFHHVMTWLYVDSIRDLFIFVGSISIGDIAPPIFFAVSGMSLYYSINSMTAKYMNPGSILKKLFYRSIKIYLTGMILSYVAYGPLSFFYWGVLQSLAVSIIVAGSLYLLPARRIVLLVASTLAIAGYYYFYPHRSFLSDEMGNILLGDFSLALVTGFVVTGLFIGTYILPGKISPKVIAVVGAFIMISGLVANFYGLSITRYPASISYFFFVIGVILLLYAAFRVVDLHKPLFLPIIYVGRNALNIYLLHYAFYLVFKYSGIMGTFNDLYSIIAALIVTVLFLFLSKRMFWFFKSLSLKHTLDTVLYNTIFEKKKE